MALTTEDGSGKFDSEVYNTILTADEYHSKRNNAAWMSLSELEKEAALRKASDYVLQVYRGRWAGLRTRSTQALDWPRAYVLRDDGLNEYPFLDEMPSSTESYYPENFIPKEIKAAEAELALLSLSNELLVQTERLTTTEEVGPIRVTYDKSSADKRRFPMVEGYLRPFLKSGGSAQLSRG